MHEPPPVLRQRTPRAARASPTAASRWLPLWRSTAIALAAALFMSVVGAFDTGTQPFGRRLAYWISAMALSGSIGAAVFLSPVSRRWLERRPIMACIAMAAVMSAPQTVVIWLTTAWFFPQSMSRDPRILPQLYPLVLAVAVVLTAVNHLASRRAAHPQTETPDPPSGIETGPPGVRTPRFLERLPVRLRGGELYAIEAEDHYLRLHTSRGSDLILLRLADALAELEGIQGAQTHRSWWVAKAAVADARRADGRAVLTLKNGVQAPVSRSYAAALRAAGWF